MTKENVETIPAPKEEVMPETVAAPVVSLESLMALGLSEDAANAALAVARQSEVDDYHSIARTALEAAFAITGKLPTYSDLGFATTVTTSISRERAAKEVEEAREAYTEAMDALAAVESALGKESPAYAALEKRIGKEDGKRGLLPTLRRCEAVLARVTA